MAIDTSKKDNKEHYYADFYSFNITNSRFLSYLQRKKNITFFMKENEKMRKKIIRKLHYAL